MNGVIIPAFNSITESGKTVDYVRMANINAALVKKYLNCPVVIITDASPEQCDNFDDVIPHSSPDGTVRGVVTDIGVLKYQWKNDIRIKAYDLSPFDKTIMIDADYIIQTNDLVKLFDVDVDYLMPSKMVDLAKQVNYRNSFEYNNIKMQWATVLMFAKRASALFDAAAMVRENYSYYTALFNLPKAPFRNDFAFSIANWLLNPSRTFEWSINAWSPNVHLIDVARDRLGNACLVGTLENVTSRDIHLMSKHVTTESAQLDILEKRCIS